MTPKEKAIELIYRYKEVYTYGSFASQLSMSAAKNCATISANQLVRYLPVSSRILTDFTESDKQFWEDVLKEIELYEK